MISLLKFVDTDWDTAKKYLREDLDHLEAAINQRWNATFGDKNTLKAGALGAFVGNEIVISNAAGNAVVELGAATNGQIPIGSTGAKPVLAVPAAGVGITITPGAGSITISLQTPVTVGHGGTGTTTAFTTGSVVFAGAAGVYSQDNAKFFWDDTHFHLGIGTATPNSNEFSNTLTQLVDITGPTIGALVIHGGGTAQDCFFGTAGNGLVIDCVGHATATFNFIAFRTTSVNSSYTAVEAMRIGSSGTVAIGTTPVSQATLTMALAVTAGGGAGYQFRLNGSITASANGDSLYAGFIGASFANGGFTGTKAYGLFFQDITGGATNFAIQTGLGTVAFGDVETITVATGAIPLTTKAGGGGTWQVGQNAGASSGDDTFGFRSSTWSTVPILLMNSANGFVGIGTAAPTRELHVKGLAGNNIGGFKVTGNRTAYGDITTQFLTTAGGSTSADNCTLSIDSGYVSLVPGSGTEGLRLTHDGHTYIGVTIAKYNTVTTAGLGVPAIYGLDNRTGLTGADGASTTLYTTVAANNIFRVSADIFATAAVTGTATYTIKWTENGTSQSMAVTATAINTLGTQSNIIRPDNGTNITSQLTGVFTGTFTVVGLVEQIA